MLSCGVPTSLRTEEVHRTARMTHEGLGTPPPPSLMRRGSPVRCRFQGRGQGSELRKLLSCGVPTSLRTEEVHRTTRMTDEGLGTPPAPSLMRRGSPVRYRFQEEDKGPVWPDAFMFPCVARGTSAVRCWLLLCVIFWWVMLATLLCFFLSFGIRLRSSLRTSWVSHDIGFAVLSH